MGDDFFKRFEPPIMHVWRSEGHVAQAGCGEFAPVTRVAGNEESAEVARLADAVVVEVVIGEKHTAMTVKAVCSESACARFVLSEKELETPLFLRRELRGHRPLHGGIEP